MSKLKKLIAEIHRRSLWQVLLIYIGAAWACFELIATVAETMGLPGWLPGLAIVLFLLGLPFVVATALVREEPGPSVAPPESREGDAQSIEVEAAAVGLEATRRRRFLTWRNAAASFVVALALWGIAATGWMLFGGGEAGTGAAAEERPSVAALPFVNRSGLEEDVYFTEGIHDEILTLVSKVSSLSVRGRTSVMQYRDTEKNLREIGEELSARYLLEGGVQRAGGTVRINLQLVDAETDEHVWAETYDRLLTVENLLDVQSEVALRVAEALKATLTPDETERIGRRPTANPQAYDAYLRGLAHFRHLTHQSQDSAMAYLELAVELDPDFALAHAVLSRVYEEQSATFEGSEVWTRKALAAAERALALDSMLAEGYAARGDVLWSALYGFRHEESARDLKRAVALNPNVSDTHQDLAVIYSHVGLLDEALEETLIAQSLDPLSVYALASRGLILLWSGQFDSAFAALEPLPVWASPYAAEALLRLGRTDEAVRLIEAAGAEELGESDALLNSMSAIAYAAEGNGPAAEDKVQIALAGRASFAHAHHIEYNVGVAYALLGRHDSAVRWLRQAAVNGFPCFPYYERDDFLRDLRGHPEFRDLLDWLRAERDRLREVI
jgi:TolB-like protein/Flp pilus assembly protein TadD